MVGWGTSGPGGKGVTIIGGGPDTETVLNPCQSAPLVGR